MSHGQTSLCIEPSSPVRRNPYTPVYSLLQGVLTMAHTDTVDSMPSWNMGLGRLMLVFLLLQALGLDDGQIPTDTAI